MSHNIVSSSLVGGCHLTAQTLAPTYMSIIHEDRSDFDRYLLRRRRRTNSAIFCSHWALVLVLLQTNFRFSLAFRAPSIPCFLKGRPNRDETSLLLHKSNHNLSKRYSFRLSNDTSLLKNDPRKQNANADGKIINLIPPAESLVHETTHKSEPQLVSPSSIISSTAATPYPNDLVADDNFQGVLETSDLTSATNNKNGKQNEKQHQNLPPKNTPVIVHQSSKPSPLIYKSIIMEPDNSPIDPKKLLLDVELSTPKTLKQKRQHRQDKKSKQLLLQKLSRAHRSMLANTSTSSRQRFVTGRYPLYVTVQQNPTRKWLGLAESQIYLNGTQIDKSLASYDIFHWLDDEEERKELHGEYELLSLELVAEIHVRRPGYVNILPRRGAGSSLLEGSVGECDSNSLGIRGKRGKVEDSEGLIGSLQGGMFYWKNWKFKNDDLANFVRKDSFSVFDDEERLDGDRLWVTGFSLTKQRGELHTLDVKTGIMSHVNDKTAKSIKWPNEVASIPMQATKCEFDKYADVLGKTYDSDRVSKSDCNGLEDALLVTDGFLVPGKDKGGLYVVKNPGNKAAEQKVCLTDESDWFYHRAIWLDLTGDGRKSILAARAKVPSILNGNSGAQEAGRALGVGELVWLERPQPHSFDKDTGTPLDVDGDVFDPFSDSNTPWKLRVLDEGPDVMFSVADLDPTDSTIEVIASQFFSRKLSLHSIKLGPTPKVIFQRIIDERCGAAFSSVLTDLDGLASIKECRRDSSLPLVVDVGSTVVSLNDGDPFSHVLVTSHECTYAEKNGAASHSDRQQQSIQQQPTIVSSPINQNEDSESDVGIGHGVDTTQSIEVHPSNNNDQSKIDGGSLFAYRIPTSHKDAWKTLPWKRSVIATGFKVQGQLSNMINPGAPGFCYTFFPTREGIGNDSCGSSRNGKRWSRPLIGLSGDCAEAAYILRPVDCELDNGNAVSLSSSLSSREVNGINMNFNIGIDKSTKYSLMCEIKCKSTVGSLAIGYDDFCSAEQHSGYAKIYVPCFELNKVLVFAMGSGEDEDLDDGW